MAQGLRRLDGGIGILIEQKQPVEPSGRRCLGQRVEGGGDAVVAALTEPGEPFRIPQLRQRLGRDAAIVVDEDGQAPGKALDDPHDLFGRGTEEHDRDGGIGGKLGGRHVGPVIEVNGLGAGSRTRKPDGLAPHSTTSL